MTGYTLTAESSPKAKYLDEDMAELRYPYQQLSEIEKATYTALYYGINNMDEKIKCHIHWIVRNMRRFLIYYIGKNQLLLS